MIAFQDRLSDSPLVERVWCSRSERPGRFLSIAQSSFEMVVSRHRGRTTLRGPETRAITAELPAEGEWIGIRFKVGTFVPHLTPGRLADRRDAVLPAATTRAFWLNGSAWEYCRFLVPRTTVLGALLLAGYLGGAVATHVRVGNPMASHTLFPIYVALFVWGGLYLRDPRLRAMLPLRR